MLTVWKQINPRTTVLVVTGRLDQQATLSLEAFILGAKDLRCHHIILDLSDITWIASVALDQLLLWHHQMKPHDPHNREMINTSAAHIGDGGMPEIMEPKILNTGPPTSGIERGLNRTDRLSLHQEDMILLKVADFIQVLQ